MKKTASVISRIVKEIFFSVVFTASVLSSVANAKGEAKADIYLFRDSLYGAFVSFHLSVDDVKVASLSPYSYVHFEVEPGVYKFYADRGVDKDGVKVEVIAGQTAYIRVEGMGFPPPNPKFLIVQEAEGVAGVKSCSPAGFNQDYLASTSLKNVRPILIEEPKLANTSQFKKDKTLELSPTEGKKVKLNETKVPESNKADVILSADKYQLAQSKIEAQMIEVNNGNEKLSANKAQPTQLPNLAAPEPIAIAAESKKLVDESAKVKIQVPQPVEVQKPLENDFDSGKTMIGALPSQPLVVQNAANRRALVIGNDTYKSVTKLLNAREDARTIASNLTAVGYLVTLKLDLNEKEMKAALRTFAAQVQGGDEVMFFFAGHGVQLGSTNYLLPIDIVGDSEAQVKDEAIQLQRVLDDMSERKAKFTLAMIDACRDNPFKTSGRAIGARGLAPTTAATGQMVIFSAGTGQQALDRLGNSDKNKNGLFTRVFVQEMQKPNVSIDRVVKNVRNQVAELAKSVGHEQVPAIYDQVLGDFYFKK